MARGVCVCTRCYIAQPRGAHACVRIFGSEDNVFHNQVALQKCCLQLYQTQRVPNIRFLFYGGAGNKKVATMSVGILYVVFPRSWRSIINGVHSFLDLSVYPPPSPPPRQYSSVFLQLVAVLSLLLLCSHHFSVGLFFSFCCVFYLALVYFCFFTVSDPWLFVYIWLRVWEEFRAIVV